MWRITDIVPKGNLCGTAKGRTAHANGIEAKVAEPIPGS